MRLLFLKLFFVAVTGGALSVVGSTEEPVDRAQLVDKLRWGLVDESRFHGHALETWRSGFVQKLGEFLGVTEDLDVVRLRARCAEVLGVTVEAFSANRLDAPFFLREEGIEPPTETADPSVSVEQTERSRLFDYLMTMRRQEPDLTRPGRRAEHEIALLIPLAGLLKLPVPDALNQRGGRLDPHQWRTYLTFLRGACADVLGLSMNDFLEDERFPRLLTSVGVQVGNLYPDLTLDRVSKALPLLVDLWEIWAYDESFQPYDPSTAEERTVFRNQQWANLFDRWVETAFSFEGGDDSIETTPLLFSSMPLEQRLCYKARLVQTIVETLGVEPIHLIKDPCFPRFVRSFPFENSPQGLDRRAYVESGNTGVRLLLEQIREDAYEWTGEDRSVREREAFVLLAKACNVRVHPRFEIGALDRRLEDSIRRQIMRTVIFSGGLNAETFLSDQVRAPRFLKRYV